MATVDLQGLNSSNITSGVKPQMFDSSGYSNQFNNGLQGVQNSNLSQQNNFLSGYKNAIGSDPNNFNTVYNRASSELNIPTLQNNANYLNNQNLNMGSQVRGLTQGFDVNQGQQNNMVNHNIAELAPATSTANSALSSAQTNLGQILQGSAQQQAVDLQPYQQQGQFIGQNSQNAMTGFTTGMSNELNGLLANLNAGVTLSVADQNRLAQLASAEDTNAANMANARRQTAPVGPYGVYDPATGQIIGGSQNNNNNMMWNYVSRL